MLKTILLDRKIFYPLMLLFSFLFLVPGVFAIDGVLHNPRGVEDRYVAEVTERFPQDPIAGEGVYIKIATWPVESGQTAWITWTKNGVAQTDIGAAWKYNSGNNTYWEASMGSFVKGDVISYMVKANKDGANEKTIGPFSFTVTNWESVSTISGYTNSTNHVVLNATPNTGTLTPKINILFTDEDVFRVQLSPTGSATMATGLSNYTLANFTTYLTLTTTKLQVRIDKNPFKMSVYKQDGTTLIAKQYDSTVNRNMAWLTNGSTIIDKVEDNFYSPTSEQFYGFGERYNNFGKRGHDVETYIYNQYLNQNERTYLAIPYFINTKGYGILVNSTYYSKFKMATARSDMYGFTVDTGGSANSMLDYYFYYGDDLKDVIANYATSTSKADLLPKWAFGLWLSANEWDRQSEVATVLDNVSINNIAATALVLEQWSDEQTYYIWNDATYTPKTGSGTFVSSDFTYGAKWPDPAAMINNIHAGGLKVLLWQTPTLKYTGSPYTQKDNDETYMVAQNYAVKKSGGGEYRIPDGWFGNSLLLDFTNPNAEAWWMSKRNYLFGDLDIDGFKTDAGEMVWGRNTTFYNGKKGDEMRSQYPNEYIRAYYDYAKSKKSYAASFSRSGTTGVQKYPAIWAGDQESTFGALQQAVMAQLSANISGVPFTSWDLAGFTGTTYPTAELYKRSVSMSAFSPVMQIHSEKSNPPTNEERTPWNAQTRTGDNTIISQFNKFVNTRMNLLPYIFSEAKKTSDSGVPMMRAMVLDYPSDTNTYTLNEQYMFGDNLLVAPIVTQGQTTKSVYLPAGEWIDFWFGALHPGGRTISYYAGVDDIPVFVKSGAIIPMNLNSSYVLSGTIGNSLTAYTNLTFRVYPNGTTSYQWNDDIGGSVKTITSTEEYNLSKETISLPPVGSTTTLQVFTTKPTSVTAAGTGLTERTTLSSLISNSTGWYYDPAQKFTYVKVVSSVSTRSIVLNGINKVEYEAEFAAFNNVTSNTNHTGYTGTGFVDGFETLNDYVEFVVSSQAAGNHTVKVRFSSAGGNASRAIYLNGSKIQDLTLSQTADWDTWGTANVTLNLNAGNNTIKVQYDNTSSLGINLDNIAVVEN